MDRPVAFPEISLAIAAKGRCDAAPFLKALKAGGFESRPGVELILAHDGRTLFEDAPPGLVRHLLGDNMSLFAYWGAAIAQARAPYVAIMDIHSPPCSGWLDAMMDALREGGAGYYGPVEADYPPGDPRIIGYLVEYVQFHRPVSETLGEIPGNNFVVQRALLGDHDTLISQGFSKTALLQDWALERGLPPVLVEDAVVLHRKPFGMGSYCVRRYRHGRCYAAQRIEGPQHPSRLWLVMLTPLLPFLRAMRIVRHTCRVPMLSWPLLRHFIAIFVAETAWSFGELMGYLAGEGDCRRLLD